MLASGDDRDDDDDAKSTIYVPLVSFGPDEDRFVLSRESTNDAGTFLKMFPYGEHRAAREFAGAEAAKEGPEVKCGRLPRRHGSHDNPSRTGHAPTTRVMVAVERPTRPVVRRTPAPTAFFTPRPRPAVGPHRARREVPADAMGFAGSIGSGGVGHATPGAGFSEGHAIRLPRFTTVKGNFFGVIGPKQAD
jgi:hypothetical protein